MTLLLIAWFIVDRCWLKVVGIRGTYQTKGRNNTRSLQFPVRLVSSDTFSPTDAMDSRGKIHPDFVHINTALVDEPALELQAICTIGNLTSSQDSHGKKVDYARSSMPCSISVNLYGPLDIFGDVGDFFQVYFHPSMSYVTVLT